MVRWSFQLLLILAFSIWVGTIVFLFAVVAPAIFAVLERPAAGTLLSRLFPGYYLVGTICGATVVAVAALLFLFESGSRSLRAFQVLLATMMLGANLYAGTILEGRIRSLREQRAGTMDRIERAAVEERFQKLHGRSVLLSLGVLGLGVIGLGTVAVRKKV